MHELLRKLSFYRDSLKALVDDGAAMFLLNSLFDHIDLHGSITVVGLSTLSNISNETCLKLDAKIVSQFMLLLRQYKGNYITFYIELISAKEECLFDILRILCNCAVELETKDLVFLFTKINFIA